jgi:hypothetical protein
MNELEEKIKDALAEEGYNWLTSGWPDFLFYRPTDEGGEIFFMECKKYPGVLSLDQYKMVEILHRHGARILIAYQGLPGNCPFPKRMCDPERWGTLRKVEFRELEFQGEKGKKIRLFEAYYDDPTNDFWRKKLIEDCE